MAEVNAAAIYAKRRLTAAAERVEQPQVGAYGTGRPLPNPKAVYALRRAAVRAAAAAEVWADD